MRLDLFDAPERPPERILLRLDPEAGPSAATRSVIAAASRHVVPAAVLVGVSSVAGALIPVAVGRVVDATIAPVADGAGVTSIRGALAGGLALVAGLYLVMCTCHLLGGRLGWLGRQRVEYELGQHVLGHVLDGQDPDGDHPPGELLSLTTADVTRACTVLYALVYPPAELVGLVVSVGVLWTLHPWLGLGATVLLPVAIGLMHLASRPLVGRAEQEMAGTADAAAAAADLLLGRRTIDGLHAHDTVARRYRRISRRALRARLEVNAVEAGFDGAGAIIAQCFAAGVAIGAAALAHQGHLTAGGLVTAATVAIGLIGPLYVLTSGVVPVLAVSRASTRRLVELLRPGQAASGRGEHAPAPATTRAPELEVESWPAKAGPANLAVGHGELVVARLPQSAQSALTDALAGSAGGRDVIDHVRLRGRPLSEHRIAAVREILLVAPRRPGLISGSVLDNVRLCGPDPATREAAAAALKAAGMTAEELPAGFAADAGDGGGALSGGQRQRIAIARALAADPDILVLVEPTTSVDSVTEQVVAAGVAAARRGRATLVLTDSAAWRRVADRHVGVVERP